MTERVEEIRARRERQSDLLDYGGTEIALIGSDIDWLLDALAQTEREREEWKENAQTVGSEYLRMIDACDEQALVGSDIDWLLAALAQAERERDQLERTSSRDLQEWAKVRDERDAARAEVERLLIENDAARKSIGEAWDTAVADGGKIRLLEAEVERLKGHGQLTKPGNMWYDRAMQAEADLARVRAALERLGSMEAFTRPFALGDGGADRELKARIDYARAALEGRG